MAKFIKELDFLSPSPKLNAFSSSRYKTQIGGLLTVASGLAILVLSLYFVAEMFQRSNLSILSNEEINHNPFYNFSAWPFLITVLDQNGNNFKEPDRIFQVNAAYMYFDSSMQLQIEPMKMVICDKEEYYGEYLKYFNLSVREFYCLDKTDSSNKNRTLWGKFGDIVPYGFINIYVNKCDYTSKTSNCYSEEEINSKLAIGYMTLSWLDNFIDHKNTTQAAQLYMKAVSNEFSVSLGKKYFLNYRQVDYYTDIGYVFTDQNVEKFYTMEPFYESSSLNPTSLSLLSLFITNSQTLQVYHRSYLKLQNLLANIGGVIKGVVFIAILLENFLIHNMYTIDIMNAIFYIKHGSHISKKNENKNAQNNILSSVIIRVNEPSKSINSYTSRKAGPNQ
jgi:hypothetical protein